MKRAIMLLAMALTAVSVCMAGTVTGTVLDEACARAGHQDTECAKNCIKGGAPAVLVTQDGKVYTVSDQASLTSHAGEKITVTGMIEGTKITSIEKIEKAS